MLQLTPAARSEDRAERLRARGRFAQKFERVPNRVAGLYARDADARTLARKRTKRKDDDAAGSPDALAVGEKIGKVDLEFGALPQRRGRIRRCAAARQAP